VRPRIIRAIVIGICITAFGEAAFIIDEWFFPFTTIQTAKGIDYLFTIIFGIVFWPSYLIPWKFIGDPIDIRCILVTVILWGGIVFILLNAMRVIKRARQKPNR
jgi:hypothetical protein